MLVLRFLRVKFKILRFQKLCSKYMTVRNIGYVISFTFTKKIKHFKIKFGISVILEFRAY